ncbi:MAG: hypothetical protein WD851_15105 [Pirellulales bacterium]
MRTTLDIVMDNGDRTQFRRDAWPVLFSLDWKGKPGGDWGTEILQLRGHADGRFMVCGLIDRYDNLETLNAEILRADARHFDLRSATRRVAGRTGLSERQADVFVMSDAMKDRFKE